MRKLMNYLEIQNNFLTITPYEYNVEEVVDGINEYILFSECESMSVDISVLNLPDAVRVGAVCSATHFAKYPFGSLGWIVKDIETRNIMRPLALKTVTIRVHQPIVRSLFLPQSRKVVAFK